MSIDADRLNEIRAELGRAERLITTDELRSADLPSWTDVRDLLAALDAAEQRAAQAATERDEANEGMKRIIKESGVVITRVRKRAEAAEARATKATNALKLTVKMGKFVPEVVLVAAEDVLADLAAEDAAWKERDEAIAHDRQEYPTAWAYERACEARDSWHDRAEAAEQERDEALEAVSRLTADCEVCRGESAAEARATKLREAIASALTSLATGPAKDGYAYSVLDAAVLADLAAEDAA